MNCEKYQGLLSDFIDGSLTPEDHSGVEGHLSICVVCAEVRNDFDDIVGFCREHRGEYEAVPNERALWLRISNTIEAEAAIPSGAEIPASAGWWFRLMNRSWQLSFPQLAAAAAVIIMVVSLGSVFSMRYFTSPGFRASGLTLSSGGMTIEDRYRQQQQVIAYWNERVEMNKARWSQQTRETFDRNMSVIDTAVNDSMSQLKQNPHDEVSEEILNGALNDKVELLKEFSDL